MEDIKKDPNATSRMKITILEKNRVGGINGWLVTAKENLKLKTKP